jgi:hypothetical protein
MGKGNWTQQKGSGKASRRSWIVEFQATDNSKRIKEF